MHVLHLGIEAPACGGGACADVARKELSTMETRLLEYFVATLDEHNVTRAAARCHAAQSTVSAGIKALERQLGVELFIRSTRHFVPTPEALALGDQARTALQAVDALAEQAQEGSLRGLVRLGTFASMDYYDLPSAIGAFHREHPNVEIIATTSPTGSSGLVEALDRGRLDIAFTGGPSLPSLDVELLKSFPYVAVLPQDHPLASRASVTVGDLLGEPMIDVPAGFGNRVQLESLLTAMGLSRHVVAEVNELTSVPAWVAHGIGIAIVPDAVNMLGCVTVPIRPALPQWHLSLATARRPQRAAVAAVLAALRAGV